MKKGAFWSASRSRRNQRGQRIDYGSARERKRHHAEQQRYWNRVRKRWLREQAKEEASRG